MPKTDKRLKPKEEEEKKLIKEHLKRTAILSDPS